MPEQFQIDRLDRYGTIHLLNQKESLSLGLETDEGMAADENALTV